MLTSVVNRYSTDSACVKFDACARRAGKHTRARAQRYVRQFLLFSRVFVSAASKKGRQTYQRYQTSVLEQKFQQSSYVSKKQREELRLQTNLTDRQIKIWFQNRRMKAKKEKQRIDDHGEHAPLLPANPPKTLLDDDDKKWHMGATQQTTAAWPPAPPHPYQYPLCPP